jgi:hypothetical protein
MSKENIISLGKPQREKPTHLDESVKDLKDSLSGGVDNDADKKVVGFDTRKKIHPTKGRDTEGKEINKHEYPRNVFSDEDLVDFYNLLNWTVEEGSSYVHTCQIVLEVLKNQKDSVNNRFELDLTSEEYNDMNSMMNLGHAQNEKHHYCKIARHILKYDDDKHVAADEHLQQMINDGDVMAVSLFAKPPWERFL